MIRIYFVLFFIFIRFVVAIYSRYFNPKLRLLKKNMPKLLIQHSPYYRNLNHKEQKHFEERVLVFISLKRFYSFDKSNVTDEMKILIASAAIQISFGFSDGYEYEIFRNIAISDEEYMLQQTKKVHHGETNPGKSLIAFSWKKFMEGVKNPHDSLNLGLHEFAHALFLNNQRGYRNQHFIQTINEWHATVAKLLQEQATYIFFRSYAFNNKMELFAVSVEYFFETPQDFHEYLPQLYAVMCRMFNQNPMLPNNGIRRKGIYAPLASIFSRRNFRMYPFGGNTT